MGSLILIISVVFVLNFAYGEVRISLNSNGNSNVWTVRNESSTQRIRATVPGGIYSDLKLTDKLFFRQNDIELRWVGYENWIFETNFELTKETANKTALNLVFHGIDTIGNITLNGQNIGSTSNMFVRHVFPIKDVAQLGNNTLEVFLMSPIQAANISQAMSAKQVPPDCPNPVQNGECHINFLRKMQISFSDTMSPAVPSVGIWKDVEIEAFDTAIVRDVVAKVRKENQAWLVDASCYFEESTEFLTQDYLATLSLGFDAGNGHINIPHTDKIQGGFEIFQYNYTFNLGTANERLWWWPNGYGSQPFVTLECKIEPNTVRIKETSSKKIKFPLRHIELIQEKATDGNSSSFYFKVNDVPIFAKGANWIPSHILPELGHDEKRLRQLLQSVKDANMNMLRVWGGGIYESDLFYQICDELGILVWQDMMFTNALYPSDEEFLASVSAEIEQQVKRILGHGSPALWSANDEILLALAEERFMADNETDYLEDYSNLFENTTKSVLEEIDDSGLFVISSPSNGQRSLENISENADPNDWRFGDVHDMDHSYDPWNFYESPVVRFVSKYGFQSLPSFPLISNYSTKADWNLKSEFSKRRQHVPGGYDEIKELIDYHFTLPKDDSSENFYKSFVYYSQLSQALATKAQTERHRKNRGDITNKFSTTMGALYWHLNDVWPAPSWSSIEFGGRWKMLHYYAKKFFAPVIIVPEMTSKNGVDVYIVSDLLKDVHCELTVSFYSWDSFEPKSVLSHQEEVIMSSSLIYTKFSLANSLKASGCDSNTCFLHFNLSGNGVNAENFVFPSHFSKITNLSPVTLTATSVEGEYPTEITINLEADRIVPFIWLETNEDGIFSDNGFTLIKKSIEIKFTNRGEKINCRKFKETFTVRSLDSTWHGDITCGSIINGGNKLSLTAVLLFFITYIKVFY